ncbi:MAG: hypothetical protein JSS02_19905 [Planctomycetes bacterium]|nr:hypothetical protein [Planctomycetota bacterium]
MYRLSGDSKNKIIFALIGFIIGGLDFAASAHGLTEVVESAYKAFVVAALLFTGELALEIRDSLTARSKEKQVRKFSRRHPNITGEVCETVFQVFDDSLRWRDGHFVVKDSALAILSYVHFWKILVGKMKDLPREKLTVMTVHSHDIGVWLNNDPMTMMLLELQKEFCEHGGQITRILCGDEAELSRAREAAARMAWNGMQVKYYVYDSGKNTQYSFRWDFALVKETGDAIIWNSFRPHMGPGGPIEEAIYTDSGEYDKHDLAGLWYQIHKYSKDITVRADSGAANDDYHESPDPVPAVSAIQESPLPR